VKAAAIARRMIRSILALAASLAPFLTAAHAHDRWDNGEPVPPWVKTVCCGPNEVHHLRPEQVRRNAIGDYVVDIYPFPSRRVWPCLAKTLTTGCSSMRTTASMAGSGASSCPRCSRHERMAPMPLFEALCSAAYDSEISPKRAPDRLAQFVTVEHATGHIASAQGLSC
jgi:hypothetical protein